ncbi:hypothetical protein DRH27_04615 [Candidatus Falkowbacteria bacterium]|nr:MAG: hypothetical protein DRH27_04615 [Candidatus Falkowbacteria bacterium]
MDKINHNELEEKLLVVIGGDFENFRQLLQNCRILLRRRTKVAIIYSYRRVIIKIDNNIAWEILCTLKDLNIKDEKKRAALDNMFEELRFKKRKSK